MNIKVNFDNIVVKEDKNDFNVKVLMLKGEKGDKGDGEANVIEKVQVNGTNLPVTNKTVNVPVPIVDSALSSSSTNPVQNKIINTALSNKVNNSDLNNYYEISEVDGFLNNKADISIVDKKPYFFDNVASMKAYSLNEGDYVITKGYYSANDGGHGEYIIKSSSTGIYETLNNELVAELIIGSVMNVEVLGIEELNDLNDIDLSEIKEIKINKNYNLNQMLTLTDITINFNGYTITCSNNLQYCFQLDDDTTILNGIFRYNSILADYCNTFKLTGNNVTINNCDITGFNGIVSTTSISDIKITNNITNCIRFQLLFHTGTFDNIIIENNKQTNPQIWVSPSTAEICYCICNGFKWVPDEDEITSNTLTTKYGKNYYINNNTFNQINARAFDIINAINVKIENNYCYNLPGNKATTGISDDVFVLEFCKYSNISYNKVENSGENAIDLLSCQYCNVTNNELINCDGYTIDLNNSDMYTRGWCDSSVTYEYLETSYNNISDNIIYIRQVGVAIRNGRYNSIKDNVFNLETTHTDNIAVFFSKVEPFTTSIGTYGTTYIDNTYDNTIIRNHWGDNAIVMNSNIIYGENDHLIKEVNIDNSDLVNDNDTRLYDVVHNKKFKNCKLFYIYDNKKYYFQPTFVMNTTHNSYYGVANIQQYDYRTYLVTYKHFLPLQMTNRNQSFYNVTSGKLYLELW